MKHFGKKQQQQQPQTNFYPTNLSRELGNLRDTQPRPTTNMSTQEMLLSLWSYLLELFHTPTPASKPTEITSFYFRQSRRKAALGVWGSNQLHELPLTSPQPGKEPDSQGWDQLVMESRKSQCRTLTSSGARRAASLTCTGATSSMVMAGRLETILTSGTGYRKKTKQKRGMMYTRHSTIAVLLGG